MGKKTLLGRNCASEIILAILGSHLVVTLSEGRCQGARDSLAGEKAAQAIKREIAEEDYNLQYGPFRYRTEAGLALIGNDNLFRSENSRRADLIVNPQVGVSGALAVSQLNSLRLSLGLAYEWYVKHSGLNSDAPLVNPGSELAFYIFAGDFRIKLRDEFSYQETLTVNSLTPEAERLINFNDIAKFARLDNLAGFTVDWDLNKLILSAGYDHENFLSFTKRFDYLDRSSELFSSSATVLIGDKAKTGLEAEASLNDYDEETILQDHWRAKVGPFVDMNVMEGFGFRAGGGYDTAEYNDNAGSSDVESYYAYGRIRQQTRVFRHSLSGGREHLLGDNANNLRLYYVRYSIWSPVVRNVEVGAGLSANFAKEFGGFYREEFDFYRAGLRVAYQFHKYWRANVAYDFTFKDSDLRDRDFLQNRLSLGVLFRF